MTALLAAWRNIWRALERAGAPGPSPFWCEQTERLYTHPTARTSVYMVGRGGDKTRESVVCGITETAAGEVVVPLGERHYYTHIAENRDESAKTLGIYEAYLRMLGVPFARAGDTIELTEVPRGIKVLACRVGAVSGYRCIGWTADECAKWDDDGADPSAEVIASIRAMTVTHPNARGRIVSSPLATLGYFYDTWKLGDTPEQLTGHAATWVANPSVTEEQTRRLERDPRKWSREYAAIPAEASEEALIPGGLIERAMRDEPGDVPRPGGVPCVAAMDPSLGRNAFTFVIAGPRELEDRSVASVLLHREWRAARGAPLDLAAVLATIAGHCEAYGCDTVLTDQFHGESLAALAEKMNLPIRVVVDKPTAADRLRRYEGMAVRFIDNAMELPRDEVVKRDLLAIRRRMTKGADAFTIHMAQTADGRHADFAPSIALALQRVAIEDAMPEWVRAMARLQENAAERPPVSGNHRGAGEWLVWGNPPAHRSTMTAESSGGRVYRWSAAATEAFKRDAVAFLHRKGAIAS